jgi:hypothetical protein
MTINPIAANQTVVEHEDGRQVFFSYKTPVAVFIPSRGYLRTSEKFSVTTSKHVNQWTEKRGSVVTPAEFAELVK